MALTLSPETEARLRTVAARQGMAPEQALAALLDPALTEAEIDFNETVAGIRAGMEDFAAGRWISLEDYEAQVTAKRQARDAQQSASSTQSA